MALGPSPKDSNLLIEHSGTEEEEMTLTMEWKEGRHQGHRLKGLHPLKQ